MIKTIKLKFGKAPGATPETIDTTPITIFVGPNNSGKSKVLSEIHEFCVSGSTRATDVEDIESKNFTAQLAEERARRITLEPRPGDALQPGDIVVGWYSSRVPVSRED